MLDFYPTAFMAAQDNGCDVIRLRSIICPLFADQKEADSALEAAAFAWLEEHFTTVCGTQYGVLVED